MSKFNTLFKKIELFEKIAVYGDRVAFLQTLSQAAPVPSLTTPGSGLGITPGTPGTPAGRPLTLSEKLTGQPVYKPEELPKATTPSAPAAYPSIPVNTQSQINQLMQDLIGTGKAVPSEPLKLDGQLGPKTQKAVETVLKQYGQSLNQTGNQLVQTINRLHAMTQHPERIPYGAE